LNYTRICNAYIFYQMFWLLSIDKAEKIENNRKKFLLQNLCNISANKSNIDAMKKTKAVLYFPHSNSALKNLKGRCVYG